MGWNGTSRVPDLTSRGTASTARSRRQAPTLVERAADVLREEILSRRIGPGSRIQLADTAAQLGMSPIPVREALRSLAAEGLVDVLPQRGFRVAPIDLGDLDDLYGLREHLEPMATRLAVAQLEEPALATLRRACRDLVDAAQAGDSHASSVHHRALHFGIYDHCGSVWLLRAVEMLWTSSERYQRMSAPGGRRRQRASEHDRILRACERSDPDLAEQEMRRHLANGHELTRRAIEAGTPHLDACSGD